MKRLWAIAFLILSGCIVQSFHPFYTDQSKVKPADIPGDWALVSVGGNTNTTYKPHTFSNAPRDQFIFLTYDKESRPGKLIATFFKVADQMFCDLTAGEPENLNDNWTIHVRPIHTVCKADLTSTQLILTPLSAKWIETKLEANNLDLPHLKSKEGIEVLFTPTPEQWGKFLAQHAANTNAFPQDLAYIFRKQPKP